MREVLQLAAATQLQADLADGADVDPLASSFADVNVGPGPRIPTPIRHALAPMPAARPSAASLESSLIEVYASSA